MSILMSITLKKSNIAYEPPPISSISSLFFSLFYELLKRFD